MRRETSLSKQTQERQVEFMNKIADRGEMLVHVSMSGFPMSDELKARILSTLLTLMNCRENMDRAAMRQSALRRFAGSDSPQNSRVCLRADVTRVERTRDGGVLRALDDGAAVRKDRQFVRWNAAPKEKVVAADLGCSGGAESAAELAEIEPPAAFVDLHRIAPAHRNVRLGVAIEKGEFPAAAGTAVRVTSDADGLKFS